ncbi:MAG: carbamoyltransferase HypF [Bacteroidota bacterium]
MNDQQLSGLTYLLEIRGLVQGVGFRPFIFRLAKNYNLNGWVENRNEGVTIKVNCTSDILHQFIESIKQKAPPASNIESIDYWPIEHIKYSDFQIQGSVTTSAGITDISPDIAVCGDCLEDMITQKNRIDYPFINCTNCGPRFTIIRDLPYDRDKTTMKDFEMCPDCRKEYSDITDRRFHAQPIACSICGPEYTLHFKNTILKDIREIIQKCDELIKSGKIIAIKGLGGFFLACDALSEVAVTRLRKLKNREGKPFAVMFSGIETLKEFAYVDDNEAFSLLSSRRPIVLLRVKKSLAPSVSVAFDTIGAMLPYMPLHYLLFRNSDIPAFVLTSGNISDEPIIKDNNIAIEKLAGIADAVLIYNRDIYNRTDDSVVTVANKSERILRRSRGYVPLPLKLNLNVDGILATGAELENCFCIGKGNQAILSQHIGDLKNIETYNFYNETIEQFRKLFQFNPSVIVSDYHPDYLSTQYAVETKLKHIKVQHHHAHIASCMAENNLDELVIGVSFDGTGYGDDHKIWGSEFMICDLKEYTRINHFDYIPMPGGDRVSIEPWRMAISYLYTTYKYDFMKFDLPFLKKINPSSIELLCTAIDNKINSPLTSSSGRLFDAVAAMINLSTNSSFHAEAPMRLENIIDRRIKKSYNYSISETISLTETIDGIVKDIKQQVPLSEISVKFHNTIISIIFEVIKKARGHYNLNKVVLSGGTFQNKYLLEKLENLLVQNDFELFSHRRIPTNDGGIALGQLVIASKNLNF